MRVFTALIGLLLVVAFGAGSPRAQTDYQIVPTDQGICFDNNNDIPCPAPGEPFYGQEPSLTNDSSQYVDNGDGTITDLITGLIWQKSPIGKMTFDNAVAAASSQTTGGYTDWRLPTIKELYSLILFSGIDPSGYQGTDPSGLTPFLNTNYFEFEYGDPSAGERLIDAQYWSSTEYVSTTMNGDPTAFGVNFADGRIKGYPTVAHEGDTGERFVKYVRGNPNYGINDLVDNGDGTISDIATGLMWSQQDDGNGMLWEAALTYADSATVAGYTDWRLPTAKELQSIVDYTRSPSTSASAAIDPLFSCTQIINEGGATDYPFYWSSTTHRSYSEPDGMWGAYVCFGRALGWMEAPPLSGNYLLWDVHGAGAQRSDPKVGDPNDYPLGHGPQGDVVRVYNFVRLVRDITTVGECCGEHSSGYTGNTDCSTDGKRNLADVTRLIDRVYISKQVLCCEGNGNVDGSVDGKLNLADITSLIDHVYLSKNETASCL